VSSMRRPGCENHSYILGYKLTYFFIAMLARRQALHHTLQR
jgi:hypothetical protein